MKHLKKIALSSGALGITDNSLRIPKVFLGGTCNNSEWREQLIPLLEKKKINYFDPVVEDWNEEAQATEELEKTICGIELYVITSKMKGVFSIAEVVSSVFKNPKGTIFIVVDKGFNEAQLRSLSAVGKLVAEEGGVTASMSDFDPEMITNVIKGLVIDYTPTSYARFIVGVDSSNDIAELLNAHVTERFKETNNSGFIKISRHLEESKDLLSG